MKRWDRFFRYSTLALLQFACMEPGSMAFGNEIRPIRALVLLGEWFGDAYFPLKEEIESRGWTMRRVGVDAEYRGCYNKKRDVVLTSEILISELRDFSDFDCLIIPSGPQFRKFKENPAVLQFVRDVYEAGLLVASFCTGNNVVRTAGLIDVEYGPALFPEKVTLVKERVILGPRGGGPPPGDGFESAPIQEICDAIERELFNLGRPESYPVFTGPYLGQKPPGLAPELFAPGFISTGLSEAVCNFSPDGSEVYFNVAYSIGKDARSYIACSRIMDGAWSAPEFIGFTDLKVTYAYPFLSYDGLQLFYVSDQPCEDLALKDAYNIWVSRRSGDSWGKPEPLPFPVNGLGMTSGPSAALSGNLYYTVITEKEQAIYRSKWIDGKYAEPEKLPVEVNSTNNQFDCVISPDESYMILPVYDKPDGYGKVDLYITFRDKDDQWTPVKNMGPVINTSRTESAARISPDGKCLFLTGLYEVHNWGGETLKYEDVLNYFTRPGYGRADIYWISAKIIEELKPKE